MFPSMDEVLESVLRTIGDSFATISAGARGRPRVKRIYDMVFEDHYGPNLCTSEST